MNGKASKQTIVWPPLLNMAEENHKIDTTFQNWEKFNAPIVNERIQNLYLQDTESPDTIYSRKGDAFKLDDEGYLTKNGERVVNSPAYHGSLKKTGLEFCRGADQAIFCRNNYYFITEEGNLYIYADGEKRLLGSYGDYKYYKLITDGVDNICLILVDVTGTTVRTKVVDIVNFAKQIVFETPQAQFTLRQSRGIKRTFSSGSTVNRENYTTSLKDDCTNLITIQGYLENGNLNYSIIGSASSVSPDVCTGICTIFHKMGVGTLNLFQNVNSNIQTITVPNTDSDIYVKFNWQDYSVSGRCVAIPVKYLNPDTQTSYQEGNKLFPLNAGDSTITQITSRPQLHVYDTRVIHSDTLDMVQDGGPFYTRSGSVFLTDSTGQLKEFEVYTYDYYYYERWLDVYSKNKDQLINVDVSADSYTNSWAVVRSLDNNSSVPVSRAYCKIITPAHRGGTGSFGAIYASQRIHWICESPVDLDGMNVALRSINTLQVNGITVPESNWDGTTPFSLSSTTINKTIDFQGPNVINDLGRWIGLQADYSPTRQDLHEYSSTTPYTYDAVNGYKAAYATGTTFYNGATQKVFTTADTIPASSYLNPGLQTYIFRTRSFAIAGPYIGITLKTSNNGANSPTSLNNGVAENKYAVFMEGYLDNITGTPRYGAGTTRAQTFNHLSYTLTGFRNIVGASEDNLCFTVGGNIINYPSGWNLLVNTELSEVCSETGISTSGNVLVTPWYAMDRYFIPTRAEYGSKVIYRDSDNKVWYEVELLTNPPKLLGLMNNRYILIPNPYNTLMLYDTDREKFFHYAMDYNDRYKNGSESYTNFKGTISTGGNDTSINYIKTIVTAVNANYSKTNKPTTSLISPAITKYRINISSDYDLGVDYPVDVYYTVDLNSTTPIYRFTTVGGSIYQTKELAEIPYPFTSSSSNIIAANVFTEYIDQAGNNDLTKEDKYTTYTLNYLDNNPVFSYSALTRVSTGAFTNAKYFVIQGQFFGYYNDRIYALSYSGGTLVAQDPIVDCRGMLFVGNNPEIAFFWSPQNKAFYSFTGDCKLLLIYDASKLGDITGKYWYDELGQNIYVNTDKGLLVFGARNTYLLEEIKDTTDVFVSQDGITHIYANDTLYNLKYYEDDDYEVIPLDLETSFYGLGNTESTSIDRWNITVYDPKHRACTIKAGVRSITDITVKSEEKEYKITPDMYDRWSHCILLSYVPKLIKGQGIRLYIKSPINIASIVPHIMDNATGTPTRRGL